MTPVDTFERSRTTITSGGRLSDRGRLKNRQHAEQPMVRGDSCAALDLLTRLSPEVVDERRDHHVLGSVVDRCSRRGAGWLYATMARYVRDAQQMVKKAWRRLRCSKEYSYVLGCQVFTLPGLGQFKYGGIQAGETETSKYSTDMPCCSLPILVTIWAQRLPTQEIYRCKFTK